MIALDERRRHEEVWLLLPWLANGRLGPQEREMAEQHVRDCKACEKELELQHVMCEAFTAPDRVVYAPGPSFRKLMDRIDADSPESKSSVAARSAAARSAAARSAAVRSVAGGPVATGSIATGSVATKSVAARSVAAARTTPASAAAPRSRPAAPRSLVARFSRVSLWRPPGLAWAASFLILFGLTGMTFTAYRLFEPRYATHTVVPMPPTVLHIALDRTLPIGDVEDLLRTSGARIVEGPGNTGILGVAPIGIVPGQTTPANTNKQLRALSARLRTDPRVLWVQPLSDDAQEH
jgi:hypothetical protein